MNRVFASLICFLLTEVAGSHAATSPELYWKSRLPNTAIPGSISQLLNTGPGGDPLGTTVAGNRNYGANTAGNRNYGADTAGNRADTAGNRNYGANMAGNRNYGADTAGNRNYGANMAGNRNYEADTAGNRNYGADTAGNRNYGADTAGNRNYGANMAGNRNYGADTAGNRNYGADTAGNRNYGANMAGNRNYGADTAGNRNYGADTADNRNYGADSTNNAEVGPSLPLFFQEKDLRPGKKMTMHFTNIMAGSKFLPRNQADAIPFSSQKIPEILSRFGLRPDSMEAAAITHTLHECEVPPMKGEKKACLSSLESLVDFAVSSLGTKNVKATTTVVSKDESPEQEYTVTNARLMSGATGQLIACHTEPYVYAVFFCHQIQETSSYVASMVGKDGTAVEAVAVCHTNTADWNPKHVAFKVLNVKPGTVPVCHFMQPDSVTWTRSG